MTLWIHTKSSGKTRQVRSKSSIQNAINAGKLGPDDLVGKSPDGPWKQLGRVKGLTFPNPDRADNTSEDGDIFSGPIGSWGEAIEEEDYETFGIERRHRRTSKEHGDDRQRPYQPPRRDQRPSRMGSIPPGYMITAGICGVAMLLSLAGVAVGGTGVVFVILGTVIGSIVATVANIKILVNCFAEDIICGLLYLFLPFYFLYYLVTRWEENKELFIISLIGDGTAAVCLGCLIVPAILKVTSEFS